LLCRTGPSRLKHSDCFSILYTTELLNKNKV
jgi:hypothetical protein